MGKKKNKPNKKCWKKIREAMARIAWIILEAAIAGVVQFILLKALS